MYVIVYHTVNDHRRPKLAIGPFLTRETARLFVARNKMDANVFIRTEPPVTVRTVQPMPGLNLRQTIGAYL